MNAFKEILTSTEIDYWSSVAVGQPIEAHDESGRVYIRGTVETPAPDIGIIWIRTEAGERKLLNIQEDSVLPSTPHLGNRQHKDAMQGISEI